VAGIAAWAGSNLFRDRTSIRKVEIIMKKLSLSIIGIAILICFARTPAQAQVAESIQLSAGSTIPVMLEKWIDARKNKVGDEVIAKTTENVKTDGRVVVPKGSKIIGRVTVAQARTKEQPVSAVGIFFDHAALKDGQDLPLALEIQAVAPDGESSSHAPAMGTAPGTAGGTIGGVPPLPNQGNIAGPMGDPNAGTLGRSPSPNPPDGAADDRSPAGALTPSCRGVLGIDGLGLVPEATNSAEGSLIVSQRHNVHLDGRTQMMLRVKGK
jgi:hypothetical protein